MNNNKAWLAVALLLFSYSPHAIASDQWDGGLSLGWNMLTQRNSPTPDYQDLRGFLRLHSPRYGARGVHWRKVGEILSGKRP